jgi:hypothetical protein
MNGPFGRAAAEHFRASPSPLCIDDEAIGEGTSNINPSFHELSLYLK